jgi:uncharacterized protein YijF (DUF1287 family)
VLLASCAAQAESKAGPQAESKPGSRAGQTPAERSLGVVDRGIFSDLDPRLQLALPAKLVRGQVHALHDVERGLLLLYAGDWPVKVYPVRVEARSSAAEPNNDATPFLQVGAQRIGLRPGDQAELAPLLDASNVQVLAPGSVAPPGDADDDGIPDPLDVLIGAHKTALNRDRYDGRYERIGYPLGDVPRDIGVCTDVVIRALRNAGVDLQRTVHEDIARAPAAYPMITRPNRDIDHRRVKSLLPYFRRHLEPHAAAHADADPYRPGDILFMDTFPDRPGAEHIGVVSDQKTPEGVPLIINNWTNGTVTTQMDLLSFVPVTERFRLPPQAASVANLRSHAEPRASTGPIAERTTQLVVVLSDHFGDWHARLQRYERAPGKPFRRVGAALPAVLGAAGYGWGDGLHGDGAPEGRAGPIKREGDLRSPAGVFALGTVHGYAASRTALRLPYRQANADLRCVDDASSPQYNQIVSLRDMEPSWRSAEHMLREDGMYELALDLEHNKRPIRAGHGSCIFAHVWAGPELPVTGCTALARVDLYTLLDWLKPGEASWVALPEPEYRALRSQWGLP